MRGLTAAERQLVHSLFGTEVDCDQVAIRRRKWWPLQPRDVTMAPDGNLWFHPRAPHYRDCFAGAERSLRNHFVHEMTHVWQHQRGVPLMLKRHPFCRYRYVIEPGKPLTGYGIEQQAEIVADAYLARESRMEGPEAVALQALLPLSAP